MSTPSLTGSLLKGTGWIVGIRWMSKFLGVISLAVRALSHTGRPRLGEPGDGRDRVFAGAGRVRSLPLGARSLPADHTNPERLLNLIP